MIVCGYSLLFFIDIGLALCFREGACIICMTKSTNSSLAMKTTVNSMGPFNCYVGILYHLHLHCTTPELFLPSEDVYIIKRCFATCASICKCWSLFFCCCCCWKSGDEAGTEKTNKPEISYAHADEQNPQSNMFVLLRMYVPM